MIWERFAIPGKYSRLMEADEAGTLAALKERRKEILQPTMRAHGGRIVKLMGDGVLIEFASAVNAVKAAPVLRLEALAEPGGICISAKVRVETHGRLALASRPKQLVAPPRSLSDEKTAKINRTNTPSCPSRGVRSDSVRQSVFTRPRPYADIRRA